MLRDELQTPAAIAGVTRVAREISSTATREQTKRQQAVAARSVALDREIANLVRAIATVGISPALQESLAAAERERVKIGQPCPKGQ